MADKQSAATNRDEPISRNILLETFETIRDDLRRGEHLFKLKVRIARGRQIQGGNVSPKVCIRFLKQRCWTQRETVSTNEPFWGESFSFNCKCDLETLLKENLIFSVVNSRMLRRNRVIGVFNLSLVLVAGEPSRSMFNRWLALVDPSDPATICKGFLQVCVALVFPNEPETQWPDPLYYNAGKDDVESAVLTCSGHAFLKMTLVFSVFYMKDIPRFDRKGEKITQIAIGLCIAGKSVVSEPIALQEDASSEQIQIRKRIRLSVSWPSMCKSLDFRIFSVRGKKRLPLCCHSFNLQDVAVESSSALKQNVKSEDVGDGCDENALGTSADGGSSSKLSKRTNQKSLQNKKEGFMPKIGPCFVNMYGALIDAFEDKISPDYIDKMNAGYIEGCAYRGRVFVQLESSIGNSANKPDTVESFDLGEKETKELQTFARSNSFLLFGLISTVPMVSDIRSTVQFEISIGHNGINNMSLITKASIYPSTTFSINPKELLPAQRQQCGHSYFSLALDNEKPALLIESSWEDIRYRLHFFNLVCNLYQKLEKGRNIIVMAFKQGLSLDKALTLVIDLCYDLQQSLVLTPIPSNSITAAEMNEMDREWKTMRFQQIKDIYKNINLIMKSATASKKMHQQKKSDAFLKICEKLTQVSLLFSNIMKEPQLSIPDVFLYMLVNNERQAYAKVSVASIYYSQSDETLSNPFDKLEKRPSDFTKYRGSMANKVMTLFLKRIPGMIGSDSENDWPIPAMIRIKLLFGLTSTLRTNVLPPVNYYGVKYDYKKLSNFLDFNCQQNPQSASFCTDASGLNSLESGSQLLRSKPTEEKDENSTEWDWTSDWTSWPDKSVLINSEVETVSTFVYKVHMRDKSTERGIGTPWKFIGFYTHEMNRIPISDDHLDINYGLDTSKWIVMMEKNPITDEEIGWIEVKGSQEYSRDIRFSDADVSTTVRLESNFARTCLQRNCKRRDKVYTETLQITFRKGRDSRWVPEKIDRFDGVGKFFHLNEDDVRSWSNLQGLPPLSVAIEDEEVDTRANVDSITPAGESGAQSQSRQWRFRWIDDWEEQERPVISDDSSLVKVIYERRKILVTNSSDSLTSSWRCEEFSASLKDGIFHLSLQRGDKVKRCRMRRAIEPSEVSLNLQSTVRDRTIKMAPFPSFRVQRRVGKRSRICCLFNNLEQVPTPSTVTAVVDTAHISRWEMRCFLHEARDLVASDGRERNEVYAIISVGGKSSPSAIVKNDANTQLWRWRETIIIRNIIFHEDAKQVAASAPMVVIEFFSRQLIHNDVFLGRCIIDSENFGIFLEGRETADKSAGSLQWYKVYLCDSEEAGSLLAGFSFRHRDTLRLPRRVFENAVLTPAEKNMQELVLHDRAVSDNRIRFEIPDEILPRLVPHILKITAWGLRELRKYMLSRVSHPTIEFRIGHSIVKTETLNMVKSPNFQGKSHCLMMRLPVEISYLPELFIVVRDARSFGRAPLTGVAKIPLQTCRSENPDQVTELESEEVEFFIKSLTGDPPKGSDGISEPYQHQPIAMKINRSKEFRNLFNPPVSFRQSQDLSSELEEQEQEQDLHQTRPRVLNRIGGAFLNMIIADAGDRPNINNSVIRDETLSKSKPDWWCKYFLSKFDDRKNAVNYLEGDRLEFYSVPLEQADVDIDKAKAYSGGVEILNESNARLEKKTIKEGSASPAEQEKDNIVQYNGFDDIIESIPLNRFSAFTSDEEGQQFGVFLGKVRLYYLGAISDEEVRKKKLDKLKRLRESRLTLPYTPICSSTPSNLANQECIVRVYIVRALDLQAGHLSSLPNSFIEVMIADNGKEAQLKNNRDSSVEMDNNPVYGCMFELHAVIPLQTRLKIRVMDKSTFHFDEEIGSTVIDLDKRLTTAYRATCGLPECYRLGGVNSWRDMHKPSKILSDLCSRFQLPQPLSESYQQSVAPSGTEMGDQRNAVGIQHRYLIFPPGTGSMAKGDEQIQINENNARNEHISSNCDSDIANRKRRKWNGSNCERAGHLGREFSPNQEPAVFRLEDFDRLNQMRGINLRPNDNEPEICQERLALNILRSLPLVREHVETRPLYSPLQPGVEQGRLEMWVDIFSLSELPNLDGRENKLKADEIISKVRHQLPHPVDIKPRQSQPYELRVVVWSVHDVITRCSETLEAAGDLYVRAWMEGLGDTQETDVHFNALEGEGEFNWRFVFQLDYLPHERSICGKQTSLFNRVQTKVLPMLHIQLWDNRRFRFDDFVGSAELDLSKLMQPSRERDDCIASNRWQMDLAAKRQQQLRRQQQQQQQQQQGGEDEQQQQQQQQQHSANLFEAQRVYGYWPLTACTSVKYAGEKPGAWMVGKVLMELEILSKEEAALKPAGMGRGEPNQNPKLPQPKRIGLNKNSFRAPFAALRRYVLPRYKWHMLGAVFSAAFVTLLLCITVYTPFNSLTNAFDDNVLSSE